MAWLNWFSGKKDTASARASASDSVASQFNLPTRPPPIHRGTNGTAQPAVAASSARLEQRRTERNAKRELLFQAVRESMVRVGVLSSSFKFKVLSLDQRGRSFLVMIELSAEFSGEAEKLAEIENIIAQTARHRYDIVVQAVYWRYFNAATSAASAPAPLLGAMHAPISRPAPLYGMGGLANLTASAAPPPVTAPAPFQTIANNSGAFPIIGATASQKAAASQPKAPAEDLGDDEVLAFRRALAAGAAQVTAPSPAPTSPTTSTSFAATQPIVAVKPTAPAQPAAADAAAAAKPGAAPAPTTLEQARSKLLLTGYEDTEMHDDEPMPALSGTQYGELR
ncbi:MAG: hypothetical protein EAZ37_08280 [Burkholderiales bacterium]|nr:MAG: hypothetical protein EAZ37_08280 [Burkholderiales bacterium]